MLLHSINIIIFILPAAIYLAIIIHPRTRRNLMEHYLIAKRRMGACYLTVDCELQISWPIRLMQWLEEDLCELLLWEEQSTEFVLICEQSSKWANSLWSSFVALHGGTYKWWAKTCWTDCGIPCPSAATGNQRRLELNWWWVCNGTERVG